MLKDKNIAVLYEDDFILVLNKPTGTIVNNSVSAKDIETVQDILIELKNTDIADELSEFSQRNGIVHRLDKDTSGVLIVAKNAESFLNLQTQFKSRTVEKEYFAYVIGKVSDEKFEVNAPIGRNPKSRTKMAIIEDSRPSVTLVEKDHEFQLDGNFYTALKVFPKTGRTHQIRVHLAAMNHPVAGDRLYAGSNRFLTTDAIFGRLMLHAHRLSLNHPKNGEKLSFISPMPEEFSY